MALIKCPECGANISTTAKMCPHCGAERTGTVTIRRNPILSFSGYETEVYIDGERMGELKNGESISLSLIEGEHTVYVKGGGQQDSTTVSVASGKQSNLETEFNNDTKAYHRLSVIRTRDH
jgi:NMD protein affecting ribosome stability and mRNA decay